MGLTDARAALGQRPIHDDVGRLKKGGRRELEAAIDTRWKRGWRARVVILAGSADLTPYRTLWDELGLDDRTDLLLVASGRRWEARGWGLTAPQVAKALDAAEPQLRRYLAAGLVAALDNLEAATKPPAKPAPPASSGLVAPTGIAVGGLLLVGAVGWVVARRRKRGAGARQRYLAAFEAAERSYADLMVDADALADGDDLLRDAAKLKGELDRIDGQARGRPATQADPVTIGRLEQVGNQLAALRTKLLQRGG